MTLCQIEFDLTGNNTTKMIVIFCNYDFIYIFAILLPSFVFQAAIRRNNCAEILINFDLKIK